MSSVASDVYEDVAEYGKVTNLIGAVVATIVCTILIGVGIYLTVRKRVLTASSIGNITNIQNGKCTFNQGSYDANTKRTSSSSWECTMTVSYMASGLSYTHVETQQTASQRNVGDLIPVYYQPSRPSNSSLVSDDMRMCGVSMSFISLLVLVFAWVGVWLTRNYKAAAAASGASSIVSVFR